MADTQSECRNWRSLGDLLQVQTTGRAGLGLLGLPLGEKSLTPGRCDMAPAIIRRTLPRISTYDLETGLDLGDEIILDAGDLNLKTVTPAEGFEDMRNAVQALGERCELMCLLGGNNAITRPGVHGLGRLEDIGLITFDAHFDLRDTDCGLVNGNPVQALLEDGLPGANIVQIGLAPFANTRRMHEKAMAAGISVYSMADVRRDGLGLIVARALDALKARTKHIYVDFDIDVLDRAAAPGAPGARPAGLDAASFFAAARQIASDDHVRAVDLTEFDPSLDVADITALTAARFVAEILAGYSLRGA